MLGCMINNNQSHQKKAFQFTESQSRHARVGAIINKQVLQTCACRGDKAPKVKPAHKGYERYGVDQEDKV